MEKTAKQIPQIDVNGNSVTVTLKVEDLVWVIENRTDGKYKVLDKEQLLKDIAFQFEYFQHQNDVETGLTALQQLIDDCVVALVESASDAIEYTEIFP